MRSGRFKLLPLSDVPDPGCDRAAWAVATPTSLRALHTHDPRFHRLQLPRQPTTVRRGQHPENGVTRPGFPARNRRANDVRSFARGHQAIVMIGHPRIRDRALRSESKQEGLAGSHPHRCATRRKSFSNSSPVDSPFWIDLARRPAWARHPTASTPMASLLRTGGFA